MTLNRFSAALLIAWIPCAAIAAAPSIQDANLAFHKGNNSVALDKVNGFLASNPKDAQARFLKGLILTELNRYNEAIKVFSDLTEDYPELPEPYNNLAVLYAAQADYERAKQSLEMAIRTHPSYATAHENLGDIYAKMASQAYDKALQLDQSNTSAQTKLALIKELFNPGQRALEPGKSQDGGKGKAKPTPKMAQAAQESAAAPAKLAAAEAPATADGNPTSEQSAGKANPASSAPIDPKKALDETLHAWAQAWSNRDADAYLKFYGDNFKIPGNGDRAAWEAERKDRVTRPEFIKIGLDRIRISVKGDTARIKLRQRYSSNILKSTDWKTLDLEKQGDAWKIVQER